MIIDFSYQKNVLASLQEKPAPAPAAAAEEPPAEKPSKDPFAALPKGYIGLLEH